MRYVRIVFILFSLVMLNSCGQDGFSSQAEISSKLLDALKKQDFASMIKLIPNKKDIKLAVKLYQGGKYTKDEFEQLAESRQEALLLQMDIDYKKVEQDFKDKNFDIQHAVLKDSRYQDNQTVDNYKISTVELILKNGDAQCILVYNALTISGRWFLDKDMKVRDITN